MIAPLHQITNTLLPEKNIELIHPKTIRYATYIKKEV